MESIIYVISTIFIFLFFMLLKKSDEKISFVKFSTISLVCLMCYNALICFILAGFKIIINLYILSIINFIIGGIFLFLICKQKKIQKYSYSVQDSIALLVIVIATIVLSYLNFGGNFTIKYMTIDATHHFGAAREFYDYGTLVDNIENEPVTGSFMTGAYVNTGILFKIFAPFIGKINLYKIFMCFDVLTLFLMGMALYSLVHKFLNSKINFAISMFMMIFFLAGYPYLCFLYGYSYLQVGTLIFAIILNLLSFYKENFDKKVLYVMLGLLNYGLFFSYCIFIPIIYLAELIYLIKKRREIDKKIFTKQNICIFIVVFLIAVVCGLYYFVVPHLIYAQNNNSETFINMEGYIYRNIWANFLFLFPIALLSLKQKNDDTYIWGANLAILVIVMLVYMICMNIFKLSTYYYYKFNFVLWLLLWYGAIYTINNLDKKLALYMKVYIIIYMVIGVFVVSNSNVEINYSEYNIHENIKDVYEVYGNNKTVLKDKLFDFNSEQIELFKYLEDNNIKLENNNTFILAETAQEDWINNYYNYKTRENLYIHSYEEAAYKWNNKEYKYLIMLYNSHYWYIWDAKLKIFNHTKELFKNGYCVLYVNEE